MAALAAAEANAEHKTFKGAKITKAQRAGGTLVAAGGEEYFFQMSPKTPAFVQDGTRLANATLLCHDDNIVDVNIVYAGLRPPPWKVTEIHLVSGSIAPYPARTSKPALTQRRPDPNLNLALNLNHLHNLTLNPNLTLVLAAACDGNGEPPPRIKSRNKIAIGKRIESKIRTKTSPRTSLQALPNNSVEK